MAITIRNIATPGSIIYGFAIWANSHDPNQKHGITWADNCPGDLSWTEHQMQSATWQEQSAIGDVWGERQSSSSSWSERDQNDAIWDEHIPDNSQSKFCE